jgi:hypothetical protein
VALGAFVVAVVAGGAWLILRDTTPPVELGGRDAAANFSARGDLIRDQALLDEAGDAWQESGDDLAAQSYALWAGRTPQGRVVVLQNRGAFAAVQFEGRAPALGKAHIAGDRMIVTQAGVLVADGLPSRWRYSSLNSRTTERGLAGVAELDSLDGLVQVRFDENALALAPIRQPSSGTVPALVGDRGVERPVEVDRRDWPRFRDAMADGLLAPLAARAVAAAIGESPPENVPTQHVRLLHVGDVPGDELGVAASASPGDRTLVAFASGSGRKPESDLLGVAPRGATVLAARSLERSPRGPWVVVAGSPNITSLVLGDEVRPGNFALLERSTLRPSRVRGRLASGREVPAAGA